jgi:transposase
LSEADKDKLIVTLFDYIDVLFARVETLTAQVATLEAQVRKNSSNSSKPPSSNGLSKKTRSLREASGKRPRSQGGHKGKTLMQTEPTEIKAHPLPRQFEQCHAALPLELARVWERRQVIDIPSVAFDVLEHRSLAVTCRCGHLHTSA